MDFYDIIAQAVGIVAMAFNILSYQQKGYMRVMTFQLLGSALFAVNFFMLGAFVGGFLNTVGIFRALVFMNKKRLHAEHPAWLATFVCLYILSYILTFTVIGKPLTLFNGIIELLPVVAMTAVTISFRLSNDRAIRRFGLISSPSWLVYNIVNFAVGAMICEILSLCSIVIGIIRYDLKKR